MLSVKIKELRKQRGWSQQKLADKSGLSYNAIAKIEQNSTTHSTIQTIVKLADAFNIPIDELLNRHLSK